MKLNKKGIAMAAVVAGLFVAGQVKADEKAAAPAPAAKKMVKCEGVNSCKGHGACKSAHNECKGKNGCAGKGVVEMSEDECAAKKGHVAEEKK